MAIIIGGSLASPSADWCPLSQTRRFPSALETDKKHQQPHSAKHAARCAAMSAHGTLRKSRPVSRTSGFGVRADVRRYAPWRRDLERSKHSLLGPGRFPGSPPQSPCSISGRVQTGNARSGCLAELRLSGADQQSRTGVNTCIFPY